MRSTVGPVAELLVAHAKQARCDLILIGSRGMTEIGKALLGSTATKVPSKRRRRALRQVNMLYVGQCSLIAQVS